MVTMTLTVLTAMRPAGRAARLLTALLTSLLGGLADRAKQRAVAAS
jgi:hypothetical protein